MGMQHVGNGDGLPTRMGFTLILTALLVMTTVSCRKAATPGSETPTASTTASLVSDAALFHVEVSDPGKIIVQLVTSVQEIAATRPDSQANFKTVVQFLQEKLGINPLMLDEYQELGIDLTKPVGVSLVPNHGIDGFRDEVHGAIHVAVTDPGKVVDVLTRLLADVDASLARLDGNEGLFYLVKDKGNDLIGLVFHRGYVSILMADVRDDGALANYLPRFVSAAGQKSLQENRQYQRAGENFVPGGLARMFLNLQVAGRMFEEEAGDSIPLLQEFLGLSASVGGKEARSLLQMTTDSGLLKLIKPGAGCQDLLAKAEAPMVGVSLSLSDPLAVVEYLIRHVQEDREEGDDQVNDFKREVFEELEASYTQVRKAVSPASAAVLIYPEFIQFPIPIPEMIGVLKLHDRDVALDLITPALGDGERETHGESWFYVMDPFMIGLVDDYLVYGTAMDKMRAIASDETGGWKPYIGDAQLFAAEVDVLAITQAMIAQQEMPQLVQLSVNSLMKKMLKSTRPLQLKTDQLQDGVVASLDLGPFQVDRHILKLFAEPIHDMLEAMSSEIQSSHDERAADDADSAAAETVVE